MRPIRLLILLLAVSLALVLALMRPLQGRAMRLAKKAKTHSARVQTVPKQLLFPHPVAPPRVPFGHRVVAYARHILGIPYTYGGSSPSTRIDSSGLGRIV
jgi:hypothetical protein